MGGRGVGPGILTKNREDFSSVTGATILLAPVRTTTRTGLVLGPARGRGLAGGESVGVASWRGLGGAEDGERWGEAVGVAPGAAGWPDVPICEET